MTVFLIVAALMTAIALVFIMPTLLRKEDATTGHALRDELNLTVLRDQMQELDADLAAGTIDAQAYKNAQHELERRVSEDVRPAVANATSAPNRVWTALVIGLTVPLIAISIYFMIGSTAGLNPTQVAAPQDKEHLKMVAGLAERLKNNPNDAKGWYMLALSYNSMGRFNESVDAYEHLMKLVPDNASLLADYADTLAMALNKSLQGEPEKLINRALAVDPNHIKALHLSGSAAFDRQDFQNAIKQWKKILLQVPPESDAARSVVSNIGEAQAMIGGSGAVQEPVAATSSVQSSAAPTSASATEVTGTVELDPALRSKVSDTDTVFIFARAAEGPRFPLAILRMQAKDLPTKFALNDSLSMDPSTKLSAFPIVVVSARISKSGNAIPSAGDLEGISEPVQTGTKGLKIRINSQRK